VMESIVTCEPEPPSMLVRDYPPRLEEIVMRLLARSPQTRYQSAGALLEDLESFMAERSMLTSSYVVAKYMKELFGDQAPRLEHDTLTEFGGSLQTPDTREYPAGRPPTALMETLGTQQHTADEEPTAAFKRAEQLWTPELKVKVRTPKGTGSTAALGDEASQSGPFHEPTRQDLVLPFDPIDARSEELLEYLDADAPEHETAPARAYRRIETLLHRAIAYAGMGELDKAVTAVELALDEEPRSDAVHELLQRHFDTIISVYEGMLEDPYRMPKLVRELHELIPVEIEPRARLLLPWIDGKTSIRDLIARSGMQRLEAYHHLCQFLLRGIID
ncbi:MAG TPA: hypothetical protein VIV40_13440, partial [Kofleriaceae bacterium]